MQFPNSHSRKKTQVQSPSQGAALPFSFAPNPPSSHPPTPTPRLDALPADLPDRYPETVLWSVARDPACLFTYWQLSLPIKRLPGLNLALIVTRDDQTEALYHLQNDAGSRFILISQPGALYHLTLCFLAPGTTKQPLPQHIIRHRQVRTPRNTPVPAPRPSTPPSPPATSEPSTPSPPPAFTFTPDPRPASPPPTFSPTPTPTLAFKLDPATITPPSSAPFSHLPPFPSSPPSTISTTRQFSPLNSPPPLPAPSTFTLQPSLPVPLPDSLASRTPATLPGYPSSSPFPSTPVRELHGFHPESP